MFILFSENATARFEKVKYTLQVSLLKTLRLSHTFVILCIKSVNVSFFPPSVVNPPGPGSICAGKIVKTLHPYLFIFLLIFYHARLQIYLFYLT